MKKSPLLLFGIFLILSLLLPGKTMLAAPNPQGTTSTIQIVLVLDVSGSMSTPVYSGIVPDDLLALLLQMDEIIHDPEYVELQDQIKEAENDPAVLAAKEKEYQAFEDMSDWIGESQEFSLPEIQADIRTILQDAGCEGTRDRLIATADTSDKILTYLYRDCPPTTNVWTVIEEIMDQMPYMNDPDFKDLREEWFTANREYAQALEDSGHTSLTESLDAYKQTTGMLEIQDEIDRLVIEYGIPSRLDMAKSAALNLIDLSRLDQDRTGRDSLIGLVTFTNQALLEQGLTLNHEQLKPLINAMSPQEQTNIGDGLSLGLGELENNADPDNPMMVILLSDGHANIGMTSSEILSTIPDRANENDIILCTAGFADLETEVDFLLLEGLAFQTGGEYLFTNSGAELGSFFAACREAAAGNELIDQFSGIVNAGDFLDIGRVVVESNSCELSLVMNYLSGSPVIELTGPDNELLDLEDEGVEYQSRNQVGLLTVSYPDEGEWAITISNDDSDGEAAVLSLVVSTKPCADDEKPNWFNNEPTSSIPFLLTKRGLTFLTGGISGVIVILGCGVMLLIRYRQRRG